MTRILVIGFDPAAVPGVDPDAVAPAFEHARRTADARGVELVECLIAPDESADVQLRAYLASGNWDCIVVGGGLRKPDVVVELFEHVVNLGAWLAPGVPLGFNTNPADTVESAFRAISNLAEARADRSMQTLD